MNCKNCQTPLTDYRYCPACGAKVVVNRLTFKNLTYDITEQYLNLDNTFNRTFIRLITKPEEVIDSYIQGVRKRYLNPLSHLGIALTLSGILIFVMQKTMTPELFFAYGEELPEKVATKLYDTVFDFTSLFFILYIPVFGIAGYLTFNKKDYFLSEYLIAYIYIMAQWSIAVFPVSLFVLIAAPEYYVSLSFPMLFVLVFYCLYTMQRIHKFRAVSATLRSVVFFILTTIGYFGIIMLFYAMMFLTGTLEIQDFAPQQ